MMKRIWLFFMHLGMTLLVASGCNRKGGEGNENEAKIPVVVSTVELGAVSRSLSYNGDIKAEYEVKVFSKIPNRIEKYFVDEGSRVNKGDPIAQIEATTLEQAVRQAEAALAAARAQDANVRVEFQRANRLYEEKALSQQQFDAVKTQLEATQAQVEQAEAMLASVRSQLADAKITAPIRGIIASRPYDAGDMASPASPVVTIVQMERVKATFEATELDLSRLRLGQRATIRVRSHSDREFKGVVSKISPVLDPTSRMAKVEVMVDNKEYQLKPGMFARIEVMTGTMNNVITVPRHAAIEHTSTVRVEGKDRVVKDYYVFVVNEGKAEQRKLEVAYGNHEYLAVSGGIKVGEKLVTLGQASLRAGSPVLIVREDGVPK